MKDFRIKVAVLLWGAALAVAACSSRGDESSVEAAQTTAAPTTVATRTATTQLEVTTTSADVEDAQMITIEGEVESIDEPGNGAGTFEVTAGSEILGCESGTIDEYPAYYQVEHMTCLSGIRTGTFMISLEPKGGPTSFASGSDLVLATGNFGDISGSGDWRGQLSEDEESATWTMTGEIEFGEVTKPRATFPRLVQARSSECSEGFVTTDGSYEFASVGDEMLRLDFATGEVTDHGAPPAECAFWLGDEEFGRRVATTGHAESETKIWLGPFDGP